MLSVLQPPPTAEELALKEEVTQVLTRQGVLAKLKAELRAAVFDVMHDREGFRNTFDAPKLSAFPKETKTIALSLIVECLRFFHWEHTLRVLQAETNTEPEQQDSRVLAQKLGLSSNESTTKPVLFQLVEYFKVDGNKSAEPLPAIEPRQFNGDHERSSITASASAVRAFKPEEEGGVQSPRKMSENTEFESKDELKDGNGESSGEMDESMAEEVASESELETFNLTNDDDERSHNQSGTTSQRTTKSSKHLDAEGPGISEAALDNKHELGDDDEGAMSLMSLAVPPPAPAKVPSLPPVVSQTLARDADDEFNAEEEADRLRRLDAALQAMEAEDETGTLQQLKASLQLELQEQDSFVSSNGLDLDREEADSSDNVRGGMETGENPEKEEDFEDYGTSDFEEEEDIVSDISEEVESLPELSDKEDESEEDGPALATTKVEPPRVLQLDTRVDSEDALNSYDYIEDVEKEER